MTKKSPMVSKDTHLKSFKVHVYCMSNKQTNYSTITTPADSAKISTIGMRLAEK